MPIARITKLEPTGTFESQYGPLFKFVVYLDDNNYGTTNAKSNTPWYKVGTEVSYEVSGNFKGTPTFKIGKPDPSAPQHLAVTPQKAKSSHRDPILREVYMGGDDISSSPVQSEVHQSPPSQTAPINGQTVGMAMKEALNILLEGLAHDERIAKIQEPSFWASVMELASDIIRVSHYLESGHIAPSVKNRIAAYTAPAPVAPQPKPVVTATRPQPGPGGAVQLNPADSEDVPF